MSKFRDNAVRRLDVKASMRLNHFQRVGVYPVYGDMHMAMRGVFVLGIDNL